MTNKFEESPKVNPESKEKTVAASRVRMNELVMPNDTNPLGNLMGGRLMQWMDICSVISARRLCTTSYYTCVALDAEGETISVPDIKPETEFEKERYEQAVKRREMRLKVSEQSRNAHKKDKSK